MIDFKYLKYSAIECIKYFLEGPFYSILFLIRNRLLEGQNRLLDGEGRETRETIFFFFWVTINMCDNLSFKKKRKKKKKKRKKEERRKKLICIIVR